MALISGPDCVISGSSSSAALRVTQTGTGDIVRFEDSTNPDSTPFRISADGDVLAEAGYMEVGSGNIGGDFRVVNRVNNSTSSRIWIEKELGTGGAVTDGTTIGLIGSRGYTTAAGATETGAYINFVVDETRGSIGNAPPTRIDFRSDPDGAGTDVAMSILGGGVKLQPESTTDWGNAGVGNGTTVILGGGVGGGVNAGQGIRTFRADVTGVDTTFVNSGIVLSNTRAVYLITLEGIASGTNGYSTACYIATVAAYSKTLTQLGSAANHFGNGFVSAQLDSSSAYNVNIQVKASTANSWTITTSALRIGAN